MEDTVTAVSFQNCFRELIEPGGDFAQREYMKWRARPLKRQGYAEVIAFVENFTHRYLFEINEHIPEETKARSAHALGNLQREVVEDKRVEDFDTPFAIHHLFQMYLQQVRNIPSWQEWWDWLTVGDGKRFYIASVQKHFHWASLGDSELNHFTKCCSMETR